MSSKNIIIYALACDHAITGPSTLVNGKLLCPWHNELVQIVDVIEYEWRAKCATCQYARWSGLVKSTAEVFADGHRRRNHGHDVYPEFVVNPEGEIHRMANRKPTAPNSEQWCLLECGCITGTEFAVHRIGERQGYERIWRQTCPVTGDEERIVEFGIVGYRGGGECISRGRLF